METGLIWAFTRKYEAIWKGILLRGIDSSIRRLLFLRHSYERLSNGISQDATSVNLGRNFLNLGKETNDYPEACSL